MDQVSVEVIAAKTKKNSDMIVEKCELLRSRVVDANARILTTTSPFSIPFR